MNLAEINLELKKIQEENKILTDRIRILEKLLRIEFTTNKIELRDGNTVMWIKINEANMSDTEQDNIEKSFNRIMDNANIILTSGAVETIQNFNENEMNWKVLT